MVPAFQLQQLMGSSHKPSIPGFRVGTFFDFIDLDFSSPERLLKK